MAPIESRSSNADLFRFIKLHFPLFVTINTVRHSYKKLRFFLFTHSFVGKTLAKRLRFEADREIIAKLASSLLFNEYNIHWFIFDNWSFGKKSLYNGLKDKEKIIVYLKIENEMFNLIQRRGEKNSLTPDEYERAFLTLAIERIAGNRLTNVEDDYEFELKLEVLKIQYRRWYYRVAYKYKLPTPRILPFIWRLITP